MTIAAKAEDTERLSQLKLMAKRTLVLSHPFINPITAILVDDGYAAIIKREHVRYGRDVFTQVHVAITAKGRELLGEAE